MPIKFSDRLRPLYVTHLLLIALVYSPQAVAQRGRISNTPESQSERPQAGVPGFFDTEVSRKHGFSFELPTFSIDHGLTERWTVGTNVLTSVSSFTLVSSEGLKRGYTLLLKSRYALFDVDAWRGAATIYGLRHQPPRDVVEPQAQGKLSGWLATLNVSKRLGPHTIGQSIALSWTRSESPSAETLIAPKSEQNLNVFSTWWRYQFLANLDTELLYAVCPWPSIIENSAVAYAILRKSSCTNGGVIDGFARVLLNWRSSDAWLWTIGALQATQSATDFTFPYFGFNYVWGGVAPAPEQEPPQTQKDQL